MPEKNSLLFRSISEMVFDGTVQYFYNCSVPAASGLYPPNSKIWGNLGLPTNIVDRVTVKTKILDSIIPLNEQIDLLKMDIQGAELTVMKNSPRIMSQALVIQVEMDFKELFIGAPKVGKLLAFLDDSGFEFWTFTSLGLFSEGGLRKDSVLAKASFGDVGAFYSRSIAWGIGVFVKRNLSEIQALKAAAILHTSYYGYDVARQTLIDAKHPLTSIYDEKLRTLGLLV